MELRSKDYGFEGELPGNRISFQIDPSSKMFEMLSSKIYKDKILTVIRELSCNAYDSHVAAGKESTPFVIQLPTVIAPTFAVEDFGTGLNPDTIGEVFWTYGRSTKTNRNDQIGALGLGSKSPFAYAKSSYVVKNRWNGTEYTYLCFINEEGKADSSLVDTSETSEGNGVRVEMAVRPEDVHAFHERASRFFCYWVGTRPKIVGTNQAKIYEAADQIKKVLQADGWFLEGNRSTNYAGAIAIMGNVQYPIEIDSIPNLPTELSAVLKRPFVINFKMGSLSFAISRESLEYDQLTNATIITRAREVKDDFAETFVDKINKAKTTVEFAELFTTSFDEVGRLFDTTRTDTLKLLFNTQRFSDPINFKGKQYTFEEVYHRSFDIIEDGHSPYRLSAYTSRGSRKSLVNMTTVYATVHTKCDLSHLIKDYNGVLHPESVTYEVNDVEDAGWFSPKSRTNNVTAQLLRENKATASTKHQVPVSLGTRVIINDCASVGRARFSLVKQLSDIFVEFDEKITTAEKVKDSINASICDRVSGLKVILLSSLPDLRPPSVIKSKHNEIRVPVSTFTFSWSLKHFVKHQTFLVDELAKQQVVLFGYRMHKLRKCFSDKDSPNALQTRINEYSLRRVFDAEIVKKELSILILTKKQVAFLQKEGVQLKLALDFLVEKIETACVQGDVVARKQIIDNYGNSTFLGTLHSVAGAGKFKVLIDQVGDQELSTYAANFAEAAKLNVSKVNELYFLLQQFDLAKATTPVDLDQKIFSKYPIARIVTRHLTDHKNNITDLIDYMKLVNK